MGGGTRAVGRFFRSGVVKRWLLGVGPELLSGQYDGHVALDHIHRVDRVWLEHGGGLRFYSAKHTDTTGDYHWFVALSRRLCLTGWVRRNQPSTQKSTASHSGVTKCSQLKRPSAPALAGSRRLTWMASARPTHLVSTMAGVQAKLFQDAVSARGAMVSLFFHVTAHNRIKLRLGQVLRLVAATLLLQGLVKRPQVVA